MVGGSRGWSQGPKGLSANYHHAAGTCNWNYLKCFALLLKCLKMLDAISMSFPSLLRGLPLMHPCSVKFKTYSAFNYHDITSTLFLPKTNPSHTKLLKSLCDIFQKSCQHYFY